MGHEGSAHSLRGGSVMSHHETEPAAWPVPYTDSHRPKPPEYQSLGTSILMETPRWSYSSVTMPVSHRWARNSCPRPLIRVTAHHYPSSVG